MQHGYRLYWHFAFFDQTNHRGLGHIVFGNSGDINALALPGEATRTFACPVADADADWQVADQRWIDDQKR